jgi:teichoic acid ribitol-phosphate primase
VSRLEYLLASALLRVARFFFSRLKVRPNRVVLATARVSTLDGNLLHIHRAMVERHPGREYVLLLEPYSYGLVGKLAYLVRLVRGMYHLQTARLFVIDNAYLPVHVAPHRPATTVVQVWHAAGALKRFGVDTATPLAEPERTFLHRYYDAVVVGGEWTRGPYAAALRTPIERVLALGSPRTDFFFDEAALAAARGRVLDVHPELSGRRVVLYAPTFRGRGIAKRPAPRMDAPRLRAALPANHALVLKTHPNLDPDATATAGYDVVADPTGDINDLLALADILITDYSSSIVEFALLRRPIILLVGDLSDYEVDPGLYLDYRTEMIGTQVTDTDGIIDAIATGRFDMTGYDRFVERQLGASRGGASERFVERFLGGAPGQADGGVTLPPDVRHE